jgi:hypothetical protein
MTMHRNDITIAVDTDGNVWAAQGGPSIEYLGEKDLAAVEHGLYYSQLPHRAAWRDGDELVIGLPSRAPEGALVFGGLRDMTGAPLYVGKV